MAQQWADRPDVDLMRQNFAAVLDLARRGGFQTPESGWTAEMVVAHVLAATETFLAVGEGVKRGEQPECGDPDVTADELLARRAAEVGGLSGLSRRLEAASERLVAQAESLTEGEARTKVRFVVWHEGRQLADEMRAFGSILAGHASFHLPLHIDQLKALANGG